ncbi:MAG: DUF1828 domain-containing protein [Deltaproteobacteria bacterium]|nr:DUF1828 domain-containing protein [Deltaproteobacteria bacterium]
MNCDQVRELALSSLPILFSCEQEDSYLKLTTPYLYPDGDYIDLYLVETDDELYLTDLGETLGYLSDYGISLKQSPKRNKVINDILLTQGAELFRGELRVRVLDGHEMAWHMTRLSQAAVQVSDLVYSLRLSALASFREEVEEYWIESRVSYELDYIVIGASGEQYTVDFFVSSPRRSWLVDTLSSQSRGYANSLVSRVVRTWHDIHRADGRFGYLSIVDDSNDVWRSEWFDQLEALSEVVTWSNREKLLQFFGSEGR